MDELTPIPGHPDYFASETGDIYSGKFGKMRKLKSCNNGRGYPQVVLCTNGKMKKCLVHRLILLTYVGPCPPNYEGDHRDANRQNSRRSNLHYVTHQQNIQFAIERNGGVSWAQGEENGRAKLAELQIGLIHKLLKDGWTNVAIAKKFGVDPSTISLIKLGKTWSHIPRKS